MDLQNSKRYKRNTINGGLHHSKRVSSNFDKKIPLIEDKSMKADYPLRFINNEDESFIIPSGLFENTNLSYLLKFPTVN